MANSWSNRKPEKASAVFCCRAQRLAGRCSTVEEAKRGGSYITPTFEPKCAVDCSGVCDFAVTSHLVYEREWTIFKTEVDENNCLLVKFLTIRWR